MKKCQNKHFQAKTETKPSNYEGFTEFVEPKKKEKTKLICPECPAFRFYRKNELRGGAAASKIRQTTHSNKNNDTDNNDNI